MTDTMADIPRTAAHTRMVFLKTKAFMTELLCSFLYKNYALFEDITPTLKYVKVNT